MSVSGVLPPNPLAATLGAKAAAPAGALPPSVTPTANGLPPNPLRGLVSPGVSPVPTPTTTPTPTPHAPTPPTHTLAPGGLEQAIQQTEKASAPAVAEFNRAAGTHYSDIPVGWKAEDLRAIHEAAAKNPGVAAAWGSLVNPPEWGAQAVKGAQQLAHGVGELAHGRLAHGALDVGLGGLAAASIFPFGRGAKAIEEATAAAREAGAAEHAATEAAQPGRSILERPRFLGGGLEHRTQEQAAAHLAPLLEKAKAEGFGGHVGTEGHPPIVEHMGPPADPYVSKGKEYVDGALDTASAGQKGYIYHRAPAEAIDSIRQHGLTPSTPTADHSGVYFATNPLSTSHFVGPTKQAGDGIFLRAREADIPGVQLHPDKAYGEMLTPHHVPASALEYLGADGQWHPVARDAGPGGELGRQVRESLVHAPAVREAQKPLHSDERGARAQLGEAAAKEAGGGTAGHIAAKAALEGRFGRESFPHLQHLTPEQLDTLHRAVDESPLRFYERLTANDALTNAVKDGVAPTEGEQALLERVFGKVAEPSTTPAEKPPLSERLTGIANIPRAIRSSSDLSAAFRQNLVTAVTHPRVFAQSFAKSARMFADPAYHQAVINEMHNDPYFPFLQKISNGKLLTEIGDTAKEGAGTLKREEAFVGGNIAERLNLREVPGPWKGKKWASGPGDVVRASDRAFTGALNYTRFMVGKQLVQKAALMGHDLSDPKVGEGIADVLGTITGRGKVPRWAEPHLVTANLALFSPRLIASRLNMLSPVYYYKLDPFARGEAVQAARNMVAMMGTVMVAAKMAGASVVFNPESSNFGKIRFGNTRIDITGGFSQYIRFIAQEMMREEISSNGHHAHIGWGQHDISDWSNLSRFVRSKAAPIPSFAWDEMSGKDFIGRPIKQGHELWGNAPFLAQDILDAQQTGAPPQRIAAAAFLSAIGFGVQSYKDKPQGRPTPKGQGAGLPPMPNLPALPALPPLPTTGGAGK